MTDPRWWRVEVVRPSLQAIGLWSEEAEVLVLGTALCESRLRWVRQIGGGPALGVYQVEPATHRSLWADLLAYRRELARSVLQLVGRPLYWDQPRADWIKLADMLEADLIAYRGAEQLSEMFWYASAIARCRYLWDPDPLPPADDARELASCYVRVFNAGGKATVAGSVPYFEQAMGA